MQLFALSILSILYTLSTSIDAWRRRPISPERYTLSNNYFGLNLFQELSKQNAKNTARSNIFFSPYSVSIALSMLHEGSNGKTAKELKSVLGFDLAKLQDKNSISKEICEEIEHITESSENASFIFTNANALISDEKCSIKSDYKMSLINNFDAQLFEIDFEKTSQTIDTINNWVSNKTNNNINKIISSFPNSADKIFIILNAIYFKATWKQAFNPIETKEGTFIDSFNNKYEKVQFMTQKTYLNIGFLKEINANFIELPYKGEIMSMYTILPEDRQSDMTHIRKALNPWYIEAAIDRTYNSQVVIKFPKFKFETNYDLISSLNNLGINDAFNHGNFSSISNSSDLNVQQVIHAATIEVNEDGSEAAASTYINIVHLAPAHLPPLTYSFDHPFIFFIRNNQNGNILFIGEVNQF